MNTPAIIQVDQWFPHAPEAVWKALTDPALHARWWAAGDVRPVVGHRFELDMGQWGKQPCEVIEVEAGKLLKYRFGIGNIDTKITWRLAVEGAGTRLRMTQEGFDMNSPMGKMAYDGMREGWPKVVANIATVL
jgi:uncharacterized protein YndB with AHSA1/START domain